LNAAQPLTALAPILIDVVLVASIVLLGAAISTREFVPAFAAVVQLTVAVTLLSQNVTRLSELGPVLQRMDPITSAPGERIDNGRHPGPLKGRITLTNVVFGYDPEQPPLFDGLSMTVQPGEFVAIMGPSGSGKTTLLRLLLGFEHPWSGIVEYDGNDLADLDVAAVRRQIGTVTQSAVPFGSTLRECICGPRVVDDHRLWDILARAGLDGLAAELGLDADIGERGSGLSGGQRQRLMIARALLGEPPILLLDEATSALDNVTQDIVMQTVIAMPATRIAIAHRLSTVERADRVLVIAEGRIVEDGPPEVLRASGGHYARLAARQQF
jgi:ABC-type bacteriocin/lantibiotic exporter with double-glycine peptidase domain